MPDLTDLTTPDLLASINRRLVAGDRLVEDLYGALEQYETAVPIAHLRLILARYYQRQGGELR